MYRCEAGAYPRSPCGGLVNGCDLCPPGSFSHRNQNTCSLCSPGTFSSLPGSPACDNCPVGHGSTKGERRTAIYMCVYNISIYLSIYLSIYIQAAPPVTNAPKASTQTAPASPARSAPPAPGLSLALQRARSVLLDLRRETGVSLSPRGSTARVDPYLHPEPPPLPRHPSLLPLSLR